MKGKSEIVYLKRVCCASPHIVFGKQQVEVTGEDYRREHLSTYDFCHEQNSEFERFAMQNNLGISGVIKMFRVSASHASQYEKSSRRDRQSGYGGAVSMTTESLRSFSAKVDIPEDQVLVEYREIKVCCIQSQRDIFHVHVPVSEIVIRSMCKADLQTLSNGCILDEESWGIVSKSLGGFRTISIKDLEASLSPLAITIPTPTPSPSKRMKRSFPSGIFRLRSYTGPQVWCSSCKMWGLDAGSDSWWECVTDEPDGENGKYFWLREMKDPHNVFCSSIKMWGSDAGIDSWWHMEYGSSGIWFRLREKKQPHNYFCSSGRMWGSDAGDDSWWTIIPQDWHGCHGLCEEASGC